ncbi:MAG: APC family permease [Bdellovibrionales bacterium]|nr:APC family permease [Bdellovibrionales bacterium]
MTEKQGLSWIIGAGIVGADIGTSVFYSTGLLFPYVGYLAPVFVLLVCCMMWAFKKTYEEGLALSPYNGGAYVMILRSVGRRVAVLAGALTIVSYLATAAVSALSGAFYITSLSSGEISMETIVLISAIPVIIFGILNTKGIAEPAKLVTVIAGLHFALLLIMVVWGVGYLAFNWAEIDFAKMSKITISGKMTFAMLMHGFAGAFLGITGFESAAQIIEELEEPALKTVKRLYQVVVVLVSITAPAISFLCLAILPEAEILRSKDSLLSAMGHQIGGQILMTVVVVDATLTLFAAVNTAFVGFIGLAKTMAKQGNLPIQMLYRISHKFPWLQGYPLIALPFMVVALGMVAAVPGEVEVLAKVYEIAFLGVMVSFAVGVILMRNRKQRRNLPKEYLSRVVILWGRKIIPVIPLASGAMLLVAQLTLMVFAPPEAQNMGLLLIFTVLLIMAYYRWGVLENRLERRHDLHLGLGSYAKSDQLPERLPRYVLCAGGTGLRPLMTRALNHLLRERKGDPFELIVFHVDESDEGFFFESLQRVVFQQIVPLFNSRDIVLTVKTMPGNLIEGLQTLKKSYNFHSVILGTGKDPEVANEFAQVIREEVQADVVQV